MKRFRKFMAVLLFVTTVILMCPVTSLADDVIDRTSEEYSEEKEAKDWVDTEKKGAEDKGYTVDDEKTGVESGSTKTTETVTVTVEAESYDTEDAAGERAAEIEDLGGTAAVTPSQDADENWSEPQSEEVETSGDTIYSSEEEAQDAGSAAADAYLSEHPDTDTERYTAAAATDSEEYDAGKEFAGQTFQSIDDANAALADAGIDLENNRGTISTKIVDSGGTEIAAAKPGTGQLINGGQLNIQVSRDQGGNITIKLESGKTTLSEAELQAALKSAGVPDDAYILVYEKNGNGNITPAYQDVIGKRYVFGDNLVIAGTNGNNGTIFFKLQEALYGIFGKTTVYSYTVNASKQTREPTSYIVAGSYPQVNEIEIPWWKGHIYAVKVVVEPDDDPDVEPDDDPDVEPDDDPIIEPEDDPVVEPEDEPVVEPADEPVVEPANNPVIEPAKSSDVPQTGDDTHFLFDAMCLFASVVAVGFVFRRRDNL